MNALVLKIDRLVATIQEALEAVEAGRNGQPQVAVYLAALQRSLGELEVLTGTELSVPNKLATKQ